MSVTAIFVFAKECTGCEFYKATLHDQVVALLTKNQVKSVDFTADSIQGFAKGKAPYTFLENVTFYPCIMLIKTDVLERYDQGSLEGDILDRIFIYNGTVIHAAADHKIRTINPQVYGVEMSDFQKFYNDFLKSVAYNGPPQIKAAAHSKEASSESSSPASGSPAVNSRRSPAPVYPSHPTGLAIIDRRRQCLERCGGINPVRGATHGGRK